MDFSAEHKLKQTLTTKLNDQYVIRDGLNKQTKPLRDKLGKLEKTEHALSNGFKRASNKEVLEYLLNKYNLDIEKVKDEMSDANLDEETEKQLAIIRKRKSTVYKQLDEFQTDILSVNDTISNIKRQIDELNKKLESGKQGGELIASEHAILRYIERVLGISRDDVISKILHPNVVNQVKMLGDGRYPHPEKFKVVVKNNVIVSII